VGELATKTKEAHVWGDSLKAAGLAFVLFGIALRLTAYFANRSLWGDEVAIALNLRFRSFSGLLHPLDYEETMPLLLLQVLKALVTVLGTSEFVLRLPFIAAGCGLLVVMWKFFSEVFGTVVAAIGTGLAAFYQPLIYYSTELKQYGLDALCTVVTLGLAWAVFYRGRPWWRLIAWGILATLVSQTAILVLAAVGIVAVMDPRLRTSSRWRWSCLSAGTSWLACFACLYWLSYRFTSRSLFMQASWVAHYLSPTDPTFRQEVGNYSALVLGVGGLPHLRVATLLVLFLLGVYTMVRQAGIAKTSLVLGPFAVLAAAAALHRYPIAPRLVLFLSPLAFLAYAQGVTGISNLLPPRWRSEAVVTLSLVLLAPVAVAGTRYALRFPPRETSRQLIARMKKADAQSPVYLAFAKGYPQWAYYAGDWSHPELLKQRLDTEFACVRYMDLASLGYFEGQPPCVETSYPATFSHPEEIIGAFAPLESKGPGAEQAWLERESKRISSVAKPYVWVFLPIYNGDALSGFPVQRHLLERLQERMNQDGLNIVDKLALGDSYAFRYQTPAVTFGQRGECQGSDGKRVEHF
jgi:hypothetical protein